MRFARDDRDGNMIAEKVLVSAQEAGETTQHMNNVQSCGIMCVCACAYIIRIMYPGSQTPKFNLVVNNYEVKLRRSVTTMFSRSDTFLHLFIFPQVWC